MKFALPITLALGGLSLVIAVLSAFIFYMDWVSQSQLQAIYQPPHFAQSVSSAQDFATLQAGCQALAQSLDGNILLARTQSLLLNRIIITVAWFGLAWGLICGFAFLYLHLLLRRVHVASSTHGL